MSGLVDVLANVLSALMLLGGAFFLIIGGVGVQRMPDFFTRLHAASVTDTLGASLVLLGLVLQGGWTLVTVKLVLIVLFLFLTSPTSAYTLARAALSDGVRPLKRAAQRQHTAATGAAETPSSKS